METLLVRLKPYDPRRGLVLRRLTFAGVRFEHERGWYRVQKPIGDYLRSVHEVPGDTLTPLAFDVCTDAEAKALETGEVEAAKVKRSAMDELKVVSARPAGAVTTDDLPKSSAATPTAKDDEKDPRRGRRERE